MLRYTAAFLQVHTDFKWSQLLIMHNNCETVS